MAWEAFANLRGGKLFRDDVEPRKFALDTQAGALGFASVFWTSNITSFPGRDGKRIATELARQCANGGIVLLHNGEDETLDALPYLIPALRGHGVSFVTITPADATPVAQGVLAGGAY